MEIPTEVLIELGIAVGVYELARHVPWKVLPQRYKDLGGAVLEHAAGIVVAFVGSVLGPTVGAMFSEAGSVFVGTSLVGAVVAVAVAAHLSAPSSVTLVVNTQMVSQKEAVLKQLGYPAPWAWPYEFVVRMGGAVTWRLEGNPDKNWSILITFPGKTPFGTDPQGNPRDTFRGPVPGRIAAAPVQKSGHGKYKIKVVDASGKEVTSVDPRWGVPPP